MSALQVPAVGSTWRAKPGAPSWCARGVVEVFASSTGSVRFWKDAHTISICNLDAFLRDYSPVAEKAVR